MILDPFLLLERECYPRRLFGLILFSPDCLYLPRLPARLFILFCNAKFGRLLEELGCLGTVGD